MFLVAYVVPQVANVFAGTKRALPFLTVAMLALQRLRAQLGLDAACSLVGGVVHAARWPCATRRIARALRRRLAQPAAGRPALARLQRGALRQHARHAGGRRRADPEGAAGRRRNAEQPRHARRRAWMRWCWCAKARRWPRPLAQKKRFPGLLAMFARLGEQTGQLPAMLQRAANQLGAEVQRRAMQLATILEPLLIVAMGLVVMLIVLAVLLPIIQLNQFVE